MRDARQAAAPAHPRGARRVRARRKAIVLLNRRGWSNFLSCRSCGQRLECPECDVALVLHRAEGALACHHCGHRERGARRAARLRLVVGRPPRRRAPSGSSTSCRGVGDPTSGVPPRRRHGRGARRAGACSRASRRPTAGVLVGTQMVAKGHDFPDVTLGVVLDADAHAALPGLPRRGADVRARRPAGGRAGRGTGSGRVLVQTARARRALDRGTPPATTPTGSSPASCARREALRYPPFADLIRIVCGSDAARRRAAAARPCASGVAGLAAGRARPGAAVPPARARARPGRGQGAPRRRAASRGAAPRSTRSRADRAHRRARSAWTSTRSRPYYISHRRWPTRPDRTTSSDRGASTRRASRRRRSTRGRRARARARRWRTCASSATRCCARRARPVERFDDELRAEIARMGALMHDALGIGLAATQLGVLHRVLVYRVEPGRARSSRSSTRRSSGPATTSGDRGGGLPQPARRPRRRRAPACTCASRAQDEHGEDDRRSRRAGSRRA